MVINFRNLQINDEQLEIMFNRIKEKDKVTELDLSYNDFTKLPDSIIEFSNLKDLDLNNCSNLKSLGQLKKVGGDLDLYNCSNLKSLGKLEKVDGYLNLPNCSNLKSLDELEEVNGTIYLYDSNITKEYMKEFKPWLFDKCIW